MVLSSIIGIGTGVTVKDLPKIENSVTESTMTRRIEDKEIENIMSTEQYVKEYFSDIPIMIDIARCESHFRQLDQDGEIHRGVKNPADVGVMQINEYYHLDRSVEENYDIYTLPGNTAYARELYQDQGTDPWNSSKTCWSKIDIKDLALNSK